MPRFDTSALPRATYPTDEMSINPDSHSNAATTSTLYVDLDGTLIASDVLWESICLLARRRPADLLRVPFWLRRGRACLKRNLAERVKPDVALLPYREEVLAYLRQERSRGRRVVLATASDDELAQKISDHLGLFDDAFGSDGRNNLKSAAKLAVIREREGQRGFEYVGDSSADVPIWEDAAASTLVAPSARTAHAVQQMDTPTRTLVTRSGALRSALKAMRPYQWVKNALLFVPLILAHQLADAERWLGSVVAFVAFSFVASATYIWNDLLDIEADRRHPRKRKRPFAAASLSIPAGFTLSLSLLVTGLGVCAALAPAPVTGMVLLYLGLTTSYSFYFKERLFIDVLILAGLYALRVLTGGVAASVPVSPWLLAFSLFFFLSLAFAKRYAELLGAQASQRERLERRGYEVGDIGLVETMGATAGYLSVLVLALYVNGAGESGLYREAGLLWTVCPIMLFWITRVWFLARRGELHDDPVLFAATDPVSYLAGAAIALVGVLAALS